MKKIKKKTMSFSLNALSIFLNLGDNVSTEQTNFDNVDCIYLNDIEDLEKYDIIKEEFPTITENTEFKEKGFELFMKLTGEISQKSEDESIKAEDVFAKKKPVVTYGIIIINVILFIAMYIFGKGSYHIPTLKVFGANVTDLTKAGEYFRLITSAFLHAGIIHLAVNMYSLYVIGPQIESFFGKTKYLTIYLGSALFGNLLSTVFNTGISVGASGAIFGLMGSLLYFGYHYRVYLDGVLKSQVIPLILINLGFGFIVSGIDNAAHIGGLIGGLLISKAVGVKYKSTKSEQINGVIMTTILVIFLIYMAFIRGV